MRIKSVKLQNIRSYVEETIHFPEGSVLLAGDIGAGKSTVLFAIEYALFGTKRAELESSSLLRNGAHAGKIELTLELHDTNDKNKEIRISRILKRTPTAVKQDAGSIATNNMRVDATPVELRAKIIELLGYPKDVQSVTKDLIYRYTVFTPQEQMRQILYDDKESRLNTLRKVFAIDKYKKIKENAQLIAKELRIKKRVFEESLLNLPQLEEQKKIIRKQKEEKQQQIEAQQPLLKEIKEKIQYVQQQLADAEEQSKELQVLQHEIMLRDAGIKKTVEQKAQLVEKQMILLQSIEQLRAKQRELPQKPTLMEREIIEKEKEQLEKEIQEQVQQQILLKEQEYAIGKQRKELLVQMAALSAGVDQRLNYEQQLQQFESEIAERDRIEQEIAAAEEFLQRCTKEMTAAEVKQGDAKETVRRIQILETCTLCLQHVEHSHKEQIIAVQQHAFAEATKILTQAEQEKKERQQMLDTHKQLLQKIIIAEKKKAVITSMLETIAEKEKELVAKRTLFLGVEAEIKFIEQKKKYLDMILLEEKKEAVAQKKQLLDALYQWELGRAEIEKNTMLLQEKEAQAASLAAEIVVLHEQHTVLQEEQMILKKQVEQKQECVSILIKKKQELEEILQKEKKQEMALQSLEKEQEFLLQQETMVQNQVQEKYAIKKQMQKVNAYAQWLEEYFVQLVATMEKQVFLQVHGSFNDFFMRWFAMLLEDNGMSGRLDEEFTPVIEQNGYETVVTDLSGGEKTAVALAYRLALNKVINDFMRSVNTRDIIILDEPTEGFSAEQLDRVREVLEELGLKQVIIVSHETKVESFVDHVLRIEKVGHVSSVVVESQR
jgi:exonuclease SbcC